MTNNVITPRVFSAVQPTGGLHLGNYIGALAQWVENQRLYDCIYCIVDLHALTALSPGRAGPTAEIAEKVRQTAALLLACGLDPDRSAIFVQSDISAHAELAWILNCLTPVSWLERMTQYKAKVALGQSASAGLLDYPVLQAADILLYHADLVPVGDDQKQHIELAIEIARRFNRTFGEVFAEPRVQVRTAGARIMGLDDPLVKMSKSLAAKRKGHAIGLTDPPDVIHRAVQEAVTDSGADTTFERASPGVRNLMTIFEVLSGQSRISVESRFAGKSYHFLKAEVADLVIAVLTPIRNRYVAFVRDPVHLDDILRKGAQKVSPIARATLDETKRRIGIKRDDSMPESWPASEVVR